MRSAKFLLAAAAVFLAVAPARATVLSYSASLNGPSESPANASPGIGSGTVVIDDVLNTMKVHVDFSGLTGTTTASHIHSATAIALTGTAGVATTTPTFSNFPLGVTSGTYDNTLDLTLASSYNPAFVTANGGTISAAETALLAGIASQKSYLNIHTSTFGAGEIRGFLLPAPEPTSLGLFACAGMLAFRRRRISR